VTVEGWTYDPRVATIGVILMLDGEPCTVAAIGRLRSDIAAARPRHPAALHSGWSATVDLSDRGGTIAHLSGYAVRANGICDELRELDIRVNPGPGRSGPTLRVEPSACGDVLAVSGTLGSQTAPARVQLRLDGESVGLARLFCESSDPGHGPHASVDSFRCNVVLKAADPGAVRTTMLDATAELLDGSTLRLGPAFAMVESPLPVRDPYLLELRKKVAETARAPARRIAHGTRMLVVTHSLGFGGGQLYLDTLLRGLLATNNMSCLVISLADGPLRAPLEESGATVVVARQKLPLEPQVYERSVMELVAAARWHGSNVALINTMGAAIGADAAARLGLPFLWAVHESAPPRAYWTEAYGPQGYHPEIRRLGLEALAAAERVVFEADATLKLFTGDVEASRLMTIPYGVDFRPIDRYRSAVDRDVLRSRYGFSDDDDVLVVIGTIEQRKAQTALVMAFAELAERFPHARLVLVGDSPSTYSTAVHRLVSRLSLETRVAIAPTTSDTYSWFTVADAIVSASDFESMPRSLIEAMAFGRTVLSTDVFGLPELITDGDTGLLMRARDLSAMTAGVERLLSLSRKDRAAIGRSASAWVRRHHDARGYIESYRQLLDELVSARAG
jgi:glycosyltransferase involved in cell wall biosynthesis